MLGIAQGKWPKVLTDIVGTPRRMSVQYVCQRLKLLGLLWGEGSNNRNSIWWQAWIAPNILIYHILRWTSPNILGRLWPSHLKTLNVKKQASDFWRWTWWNNQSKVVGTEVRIVFMIDDIAVRPVGPRPSQDCPLSTRTWCLLGTWSLPHGPRCSERQSSTCLDLPSLHVNSSRITDAMACCTCNST